MSRITRTSNCRTGSLCVRVDSVFCLISGHELAECSHSMYLYVFMLLLRCLSDGLNAECPFFSIFFPPSFPLCVSFWGSGHVLVLIFLHSLMFMPTVTAYSFCFGFLAVDDVHVHICVKRTRMSAPLHSSFLPPVHAHSFLSSISLILSTAILGGLGTHAPCVSLCCLTLLAFWHHC